MTESEGSLEKVPFEQLRVFQESGKFKFFSEKQLATFVQALQLLREPINKGDISVVMGDEFSAHDPAFIIGSFVSSVGAKSGKDVPVIFLDIHSYRKRDFPYDPEVTKMEERDLEFLKRIHSSLAERGVVPENFEDFYEMHGEMLLVTDMILGGESNLKSNSRTISTFYSVAHYNHLDLRTIRTHLWHDPTLARETVAASESKDNMDVSVSPFTKVRELSELEDMKGASSESFQKLAKEYIFFMLNFPFKDHGEVRDTERLLEMKKECDECFSDLPNPMTKVFITQELHKNMSASNLHYLTVFINNLVNEKKKEMEEVVSLLSEDSELILSGRVEIPAEFSKGKPVSDFFQRDV